MLGSALMYMAGMVLNDVFDVEVDRAERPERPLPSGRIAVGWARWLGFEMLFFRRGVGRVGRASWRAIRGRRPWPIGLAVLILLYNRVLKATFFGPIAMGGCRFLERAAGHERGRRGACRGREPIISSRPASGSISSA